jgi:Amt family ammonium transporter
MAASVDAIAHILVVTNLAAATGALGALAMSWRLFGKPDISMTLNGILAGLVAITAPCAFVGAGSAALIGLVAGLVVVGAVVSLERSGVDDPVGAIAVHGVCGIWGTAAVGLFASAPYSGGDGLPGLGLFFGGGTEQLITQLIGALAAAGAAFFLALVLFGILKATIGLRVSPEEELAGLDAAEHGNEAYPAVHHPIHSPAVVSQVGSRR